MKNSNLKTRLPIYLLGLFIMTLGIAMSVKSDLGVSPISSIPYTMTCIWGLEMGKATILLHCSLVLLQILILRKRFEVKNLLQILVGIIPRALTPPPVPTPFRGSGWTRITSGSRMKRLPALRSTASLWRVQSAAR